MLGSKVRAIVSAVPPPPAWKSSEHREITEKTPVILLQRIEATEPIHDLELNLTIPKALNDTGIGLTYCRVPKTGSTIIHTILCDLLRMLHGIQFEQKFDAGLDGANPCFLNDSFIHNGIATWPVKNPPLLFTVVRDPIDRFVSIYGHFCVTNSQCGDKTIHQFAEDVYLSYTGHMSFVTENPIVRLHAFPHTEFCGLYQDHKKYEVIYYSEDREDMRRQFLNIFDKAEVPRAASERALNHLTMSSTLHAMKSASKKVEMKKELLSNSRTEKIVRAIYHSDYRAFNFE
ncbi:unnamed protein product, partial [Mesorhabditis spiculigera]